ncbi:MAG: hypothetical protein HKM07_07975 [Chlamydiae bacterium]|nr:hypothetical protein [Chlamydiota bacterium]
MPNRVSLLIDILLDKTAREDERHDAAMDIGEFNDDRALNALVRLASDPNEDNIVLDVCGESIAEILVKRNELKKDILEKLDPIAKRTADAFIKEQRPDWQY